MQRTGYTIPDNADEDLLISQVAYACTKPEVEGAGAPLLFHHALSSIVFKVNSGIYEDRNSDGGVDTDLRITKIEIVDARAQGNFSQQMSDWMGEQMNAPTDEQNPEKGWDVPANALLKTFTAYDKQKVGSEGQLLTDNFEFIHDMAIADERTQSLTNLLMLPQELKENVLLRVTFDMTHSDITYWLTDRVKTIPLNKCGVEEWLRGYRYCYYITLSLNKIVCSTEVDQWNDYETLENLENATIKDLNETVYELE